MDQRAKPNICKACIFNKQCPDSTTNTHRCQADSPQGTINQIYTIRA